jgi:hypothetical protein
MPLDKDPQGGGTEQDGTKSKIYCSLCYKDGAFIGADCTVEEMQHIVDEAMQKQGFNWFMRKMALWQIPHLGRWKKS